MVRKLRDFLRDWSEPFLFIIFVIGLIGGGVWYATRPTTYDFDNGVRLVVPSGAISIDQRNEGNGILVQSGVNATVHNDSDEWRSLIVSYRKPNALILDTYAIEELPPKSSMIFGAERTHYDGMHVSISDYAQKKRDKTAKK